MKVIKLFFAMVLIVTLISCSENNTVDPNNGDDFTNTYSSVQLSNGSRSDDYRIDNFEVKDVSIVNDSIYFKIQYSGGCNEHEFRLTANDYFKESFPVQADMILSHNDFNDACDSIVEIELSFDLSPLKEAYINSYGGNLDPIALNILIDKTNNAWLYLVYQSSTIYINSFETNDDTNGWAGIDVSMFVDDPAPGCGEKSLFIGGGCVMPTASKRISITENGNYKLSCWGKTTVNGGNIHLIKNEDEVVELIISGNEWSFFESTDSIYLEAGDEVSLEIWVGGIIYDDLFCDNLAVIKR